MNRDQLREALAKFDALDDKAHISVKSFRSFPAFEAARLVADPDTLIISKVDGEWPASAEVLRKLTAMGYDGDWESAPPAEEAIRDILDALLEGKPK